MRVVAMVIVLGLMAGCSTTPEYYCKAGYAHTYSYNSGWKQIWSEEGGGVRCSHMKLEN